MYRVLCFALLCGAPAAVSAAPVPPAPVSGASVAQGEQLAALLYGFRATGEPVPHPMNAADGNRMWDALGGGCIDGGSWDEPYPAGKSDIRTPAFCIPQPCVRALSQEELEREVLGRRLEEGEYATYLERLEETCGELPPSLAGDDPGYLQLASLGWPVLSTSDYGSFEAPGLLGGIAVPTAAARDLLWVRPPARPDRGGFAPRAPFDGPSFGGGGRSKPDRSDGGSTQKPTPTPKPETKSPPPKVDPKPKPKPKPKPEIESPPSKVDPKPKPKPEPEIESPPSKFEPKPKPDPDTPTPDPDPETPDPNVPQPSPVPLPGGLPMLVTALAAAFALRRR